MTRRRLDIDWEELPLGMMSDADIGRMIGVDPKTVTRNRAALGIDSYRSKYGTHTYKTKEAVTIADLNDWKRRGEERNAEAFEALRQATAEALGI